MKMVLPGDFEEGEETSQLLGTEVEHVTASVSHKLLSKFAEHSAYDFDYTESSIWSPLLPRPYAFAYPPPLQIGPGIEDSGGCRRRRIKPVRKANSPMWKVNLKAAVFNKKKSNATPPVKASSTRKKGWGNVLKVASKQFKKRRTKDANVCRKLHYSFI